MSAFDKLSKMIGPGPKMLFAIDTESEPGKEIMHFVQFHTLHVEKGKMDDVEIKTPKASNDERLDAFGDIFIEGKLDPEKLKSIDLRLAQFVKQIS